ncbi:MAG: hypothetical protein ACYDEU_10095 [Vulcanimicrobiaceae bacterium]
MPLDLHAVTRTGSAVFACGTPLRVRHVVALAVREAIGARAPRETFQRSLRATLDGLSGGRYAVHIDGRRVRDPEAVIVCDAVAQVRFYLPHTSRAAVRHPEPALPKR